MFYLSKSVTERIKSLGQSPEVQAQVEAIKGIPGFEVYANAIAEGVRDNLTSKSADTAVGETKAADSKKPAR